MHLFRKYFSYEINDKVIGTSTVWLRQTKKQEQKITKKQRYIYKSTAPLPS